MVLLIAIIISPPELVLLTIHYILLHLASHKCPVFLKTSESARTEQNRTEKDYLNLFGVLFNLFQGCSQDFRNTEVISANSYSVTHPSLTQCFSTDNKSFTFNSLYDISFDTVLINSPH